MKRLEWYTLRWSINKQKKEYYNVFNNWVFTNDIIKIVNDYPREEVDAELLEKVRRTAQYYFWSKCEYECSVTDLGFYNQDYGTKTDVYDQLNANLHAFCEFLLSHRNELTCMHVD